MVEKLPKILNEYEKELEFNDLTNQEEVIFDENDSPVAAVSEFSSVHSSIDMFFIKLGIKYLF